MRHVDADAVSSADDRVTRLEGNVLVV